MSDSTRSWLRANNPLLQSDNPLNANAPTLADAWQQNALMVSDWINQQRQISEQRGLWGPQGITGAGVLDAAGQTANALLMGTTAPGSPHFALDPYELKAPTNLTTAQQGAVDHYSNNSLYLNGDSPEAGVLRTHLDAAIDKSRLSDNATLYRGFSIPTEHIEQIKPGDVVPLSTGYVSTTAKKDVARNFSNDDTGGDASVLVEIRVPKGHPALHIPTSPEIENEFGAQHEVLLPRSTQFRIHSINEKSDGRYDVLASPD